MVQTGKTFRWATKLLRPATTGSTPPWAFVLLPKAGSETLPRRGRTTVDGLLNGKSFRQTLEPDGQLSHWLPLSEALCALAGADVGDVVHVEVMPVDAEPEPALPDDLLLALAAAPQARQVWEDTTTIARLDWIHWITSAKQPKTRAKRISDACDMLAGGKKRVCCFDPSGYYSKSFHAPQAVD